MNKCNGNESVTDHVYLNLRNASFPESKMPFVISVSLSYSKMDIPNPPTSKCITYWKRKVKSEYMRLRQLKRLQANMGAKVKILPK